MTGDGVGAYQLRVGQPPGSTEPLVALEPHMGHLPGRLACLLAVAAAVGCCCVALLKKVRSKLPAFPLLSNSPAAEEVDVVLTEARPNDPAVPEGKVLARVGGEPGAGSSTVERRLQVLQGGAVRSSRVMRSVTTVDESCSGAVWRVVLQGVCPRPVPHRPSICRPLICPPAEGDQPGCPSCCTYLLNSQSVEALAFRVDVVSRRDGALLARCYVEPQTLQVGGAWGHVTVEWGGGGGEEGTACFRLRSCWE